MNDAYSRFIMAVLYLEQALLYIMLIRGKYDTCLFCAVHESSFSIANLKWRRQGRSVATAVCSREI